MQAPDRELSIHAPQRRPSHAAPALIRPERSKIRAFRFLTIRRLNFTRRRPPVRAAALLMLPIGLVPV